MTFNECRFAPGILRAIIERCQSLDQFALIYDLFSPVDSNTQRHIFNDFEALETEGITRNVTDFTLKLYEDHNIALFTNRTFLRFFAIFPNIKNLDLSVQLDNDTFYRTNSMTSSDTEFSFASLHYQLSQMSDQLEKLSITLFDKIEVVYHRQLSQSNILNRIAEIKMKNLKKLSFYWAKFWDGFLRNPVPLLEHLTHFECVLRSDIWCNELVLSFIQLLLNTATELRSLQVSGFFIIDRDCFISLVKSKLTTFVSDTLDCDFFECYSHDFIVEKIVASIFDDSLAPNYTLKNISLLHSDQDVWYLFTLYFRNLDTLLLPSSRNDILRNIFQYQTKLRSLNVCNGDEVAGHGKLPENRQLEYLTHLQLKDQFPFPFVDFVLSEFIFPRLKSVHIRSDENIGGMVDWKIFRNYSQLELVRFELPIGLSFEEWLSLLSSLPNLRVLDISDHSKLFRKSKYDQLFETYSSLREIRHNTRLFTCYMVGN